MRQWSTARRFVSNVENMGMSLEGRGVASRSVSRDADMRTTM
jgi:hypothetical protein